MRFLLLPLLLLLGACSPEPVTIPAIPVKPLDKPVEAIYAKPEPIVVTAPTYYGPQKVARWGPTMRREAQAIYGINAPIPMLLGQIQQESGGSETVTASDLGRGLAQMMDATARQIAKQYPELGAPDPYSAIWSIRAMIRLNQSNYKAVQGDDDCQRWGATLVSYNSGRGWVAKAQRHSEQPGIWFGITEKINSGQSAQNFKYSRSYPHKILQHHQPLYRAWGNFTCEGLA